MNTDIENTLKFMKSELEKVQIKVVENENGREGVDFLIGDNQIYF